MKTIISLTTIPSRLSYLETCLNSLKNQTVMPDQIMIHIPKFYTRFQTSIVASQIPSSCLPHVLYLDTDYGPGTKLMGCLSHLAPVQLRQSLIVLVDDDQIYQPHFIEGLLAHLGTDRQIPVAASYRTYSVTVRKRKLKIGCGFSGFAIPGRCLNWTTLLEYFQFVIGQNSLFFFHDDLWISYYLNLVGVRITQAHKYELEGGRQENPRLTNHSQDRENLHHALKQLPGVLSRKNIRKECLRSLKKNHQLIVQMLSASDGKP